MANGYAGKILIINLTTKEVRTIDTVKYEEFGGGVGIGAAIFWDLAVVPGDWDMQDAFDPRNVISLMTGPLAATGVPGAGRTSVSGIAPETYPTPLFHRTSFRSRFGTMLKLGGAVTMLVKDAPPAFKGMVPMEPGMGWYIKYLYEIGELGPSKKIESYPLPMDQWDTLKFLEIFCDAITRRVGIGADLADGVMESAHKWGRLEKDLNEGTLRLPAWGASWHHALPGVEWAYSYIFMSGDPVWHGFFGLSGGGGFGGPARYTAEELVEMMSKKVVPFDGEPIIFGNSWKGDDAYKTGIYSPYKEKMLAWARRFTGFYNEGMSICEMLLPVFMNSGSDDIACPSPELEYRYYKAVTGKNHSFADTMETGRKIWNMERAIRVMAGRHRDQEKFAPFMPMQSETFPISGPKPVYTNGKWSFESQNDLYLDRKGVEQFKTNFYKLEGWSEDKGWPTRKTLEGLGMNKVADIMAAKGKLGV